MSPDPSNRFRGGWITCTKQYVTQLPIRLPDLSDASDRRIHDAMVEASERLVELYRTLRKSVSEAEREATRRAVEATEVQIDEMVYRLYWLNKAEVALVEHT